MDNDIRHEIVSSNPDIEVRFYLSEDNGSYVAPHWHNSLELVYMLEGSMVTQYENNVRQTIEPGEISVVNPRVIHSVTAQKNKALVLLIPSALLEKYIPAPDFLEFRINMHPENPVEITRLERLKKIFMDMYIVYDIRPDAYLLKFNSLLYDLLYTMVHSYSVKAPWTGSEDVAEQGQHTRQKADERICAGDDKDGFQAGGSPAQCGAYPLL